ARARAGQPAAAAARERQARGRRSAEAAGARRGDDRGGRGALREPPAHRADRRRGDPRPAARSAPHARRVPGRLPGAPRRADPRRERDLDRAAPRLGRRARRRAAAGARPALRAAGGGGRGVRGLRALALAAAVATLGGAPGPAGAETIRVDAVGVAPAGPSAREAALASGVREAVLLVAGELARGGGPRVRETAELEKALGPDRRSYAERYRLAEDRGERPAQLVGDPGVAREYVVVVDAQVDRERVRAALLRAGLLGPVSPGGVHSLWVTIEGVEAWPTWERLRRTLAARGGSVRPIEFARGALG